MQVALVPILTSLYPVPKSCLKLITCNCTKQCKEATAIAGGRICHVHMHVTAAQAETSAEMMIMEKKMTEVLLSSLTHSIVCHTI